MRQMNVTNLADHSEKPIVVLTVQPLHQIPFADNTDKGAYLLLYFS